MLDIRPTSLLDAVQRCNEFDPSEYAPVFVENQQVGFASEDLVRKLRGFTTGVEIAPNPNMYYTKGDQTVLSSNAIFLAPEVSNLRERTGVMEALIDELIIDGTIPPEKVRNELQDIYPLDSGWTGEPLLKIERAAMTYFGIPSYAAHVNGYVADAKTGRPSALWLGRRALSKPTYPGLLDQIAAGGQPAGMSFDENVRKECLEEASLSADVLEGLRPAGMVSYRYSTRRGLSTKTIAVYDLQLPDDVFPSNGDGEVDEFILMPMDEVMRSLKDELPKWKPNSALVAVDFLVRHGFVGPDDADYIEITHLLRAASPPRSS
uniref:Nudix hydrolase domain-containing protein n=2 Tax=Lotharella globosa TaxID=91324 RepID=A0A7S3YNN7_9EUKA